MMRAMMRDVVALEPERIAAPVPALVVQVHARDERVQELDGIEDVLAVRRVPLEDLVLVLRELARLVQVHHAADLADVVHQRALPHDLDDVGREPEPHGEVRRVDGDALGVAGGVAVHLVDGPRQALDGLLERGAQILVEARVLDRGGGARADDRQELAVPLVEPLLLGEARDADPAEQARLHPQRHGDERHGRQSPAACAKKREPLLPCSSSVECAA